MKFKGTVLRLIDCCIWTFSFLFSLWITKHMILSSSVLIIGIILIAVHALVFELAKMYKYIWRYLNSFLLLKGGLCQVIASFVLILILECLGVSAKRIIVVSLCTEIVLWCLTRLAYVALRQLSERSSCRKHKNKVSKKRLMLIGGGEAAELFLDEIERNKHSEYEPVCVVDDLLDKIGRYLHSVKILGSTSEIKTLCVKHNIEVIVFAIYNIDNDKKQHILNTCAELNIPVKMLPHYAEFVGNIGKNITAIRDVSIEDLLCREKNHIDNTRLNEFIENKTVMVTGGGGSIGGELCKQISKYNPRKLIIVDICENGAYTIQQELIQNGFENIIVEIVSVTDEIQMEKIFGRYTPDIVYHAAAHKHVPLMEHCKIEAVKNNVFGTKIVSHLASMHGVEKFILVSTDKAVNPTNVMGATKRCCELIIKAANETSSTDFVAVRFGNVLGSNGSVIPLFKEQLKNGGPITVTDPECIRYFMTIPEAVELLLTAGSIAKGGETFILDMGQPVKIVDLAKKMISLSGFVPDKDIHIKYIGMRPGEKMYEELLVNKHNATKTCNEKVFVDIPEKIDSHKLENSLNILHSAVIACNEDETIEILQQIVPTYHKA